MKKLHYIENFLSLVQAVMLAAMLLTFYLVFNMKEDSYVDLFNPHFEFESGRNLLQSELNRFLDSESSKQFVGPDNAKLEVSKITLSTKVTAGWKWAFAGFITVYFSLAIGIFQIIKKIIASISKNASFGSENIKRIKWLGIVLVTIPIFEWIVDNLMLMYYSGQYSMKYMTLESSNSFDWTMFNLSLLIYTLGYAFDQGRSLEAEQELTI